MTTEVVGGYLTLSSVSVHFLTAGDQSVGADRPLLILLHQSPLSSRRYRKVLPLLAQFCIPVAIDTPGYGNSEDPSEEFHVSQYAALVWEVVDAWGAEKAWLFGRATGAVFALQAAADRPHRTIGTILHGLPVYTDEEKRARLASFAPTYLASADGSHLHQIWQRIQGEYPWASAALLTEFVRDYLAAGADYSASYRAIWRHDLRSSTSRAAPIDLLLAGDADRIFFMHQRAVAAIAHRRALVLEGATDFLAEQDPERFAAVIREVLAPLEPAVFDTNANEFKTCIGG